MKIKLPDKKKLITWAIIFSFALLGIIAGIYAILTHRAIRDIRTQLEAVTSESKITHVSAPMIATDAIYRLYECGGKIGIYDAKTEILIDIVDVYVSTLPAADRIALKKRNRHFCLFRTRRYNRGLYKLTFY